MPGFSVSPVELTTSATDALLSILAFSCVLYLRQYRDLDHWKVGVWSWALATLCLAALLGAVIHGFEWSEATSTFLWRPLYFLLALIVALFVVAAAYDGFGERRAWHVLAVMIPVAGGFFAITQIGSESFRIFVVYEILSMGVALGIYIFLAVRKKLRGAGLMASAILLNVLAAGIQANESLQITLVWTFDHNGLFHIVQIIAILFLMAGLRRSFRDAITYP